MTKHDRALILLPILFNFSLGCHGGDSAQGPPIRSPAYWLYPDVNLWCRHNFNLPGPASAEACDALSPEDLVDAPQPCASRYHGALDVQIDFGGRFYFDDGALVAVWPTTDIHPGGWWPPYWYGDVIYCENEEGLGQPW